MQDMANSPRPRGTQALQQREFFSEHKKEFKPTPKVRPKRKFITEGMTLHRQKTKTRESKVKTAKIE